MESDDATTVLSALAQPTRLEAWRTLVASEPHGVPAGDLAARLAVPANTLSAHLAILTQAGLVRGERRGRSIGYRANLERLQALVLFLLRDCCGGRPEICAPVIAGIVPCCPKTETTP